MTLLPDQLAHAITLIAVLLELLYETRGDLLLLDCEALAFAIWAHLHVFGGVGSGASTVGADDLTVISYVELISFVELLEGDTDF